MGADACRERRRRVDSELADERQARIDSITLATSSIIRTRQAGIDASVAAAIATERAAADARTDGKIGRVTGRIDEVADDLATETAARTAADADMKTELQSRMISDRDEFKRGLQREITARTAAVDAAKREAAQAVTAEQAARTRAVTDGDRAVKAELAADMTAKIGAAESRMGSRIAGAGFPRGTRMLFQQSNAPTGWTKDTAQNDRALRVVSGAVGSGGSKGFAATFGRPRVSGSITSRVSGRAANHRLSIEQIPRHEHYVVNSHNVPNRSHETPNGGNYVTRGASHNPEGDEKYLLRANRTMANAGRTSPAGLSHEHDHGAG